MAVGRLARRFTVMLLVSLLVAACSSGGGTPSPASSSPSASSSESPSVSAGAATYAKGLCGAEATWMAALQSRTTKMTSGLSAFGNATSSAVLVKAKKVMVGFFGGIVKDTDQLISDVQALGVPDVEGGDAAQAAILDVFTKMRDLYAKFGTQMKALPTNNFGAFTKGLNSATAGISTAAQDLGTVASGMTNPALKDAFKAEPACASFQGSGG